MSEPKKKKTFKDLSDVQKKDLFLKPCKNIKEFDGWIANFLDLRLPDVTVSRFADTNPLGATWEIYDLCVNKNNPNGIKELLYVAARGSGKTLGMAIAEFMVILHDHRDTAHIGAILAQAKRCYNYQTQFMLKDKIRKILQDPTVHSDEHILQKMNMEKSVFKFGDTQVNFEILPCTLKAVNGFHGPLVVVDEADTISGEGLRAFKDITGMLDTKNGKEALRVGISTRKSRYGLMNKQMENADAEGRTVRKWTVFEFCKRCPDSKSGVNPTEAYIVIDRMETICKDEFDRKDKKKQQEYVKYTLPGEKCLKCPAAAICLGDAKNQTSKSPMLKPIDEAIQKVRSEGVEWSLSQLVNLKPSVEGIVYKEFDEKLHTKSWNELWEMLTGSPFPGECTHDMFVKKCHQLGLPFYGAIDWGWSSPSTVVYFCIDKTDNIYVVKTDGMTYVSQPEWIHFIKTRYHNLYRPQLYFPDQADQGAILEMKKAGLNPHNQAQKPDINPGIQVIKKFLRVPGSPTPKLFLAKETCIPLIQEFGMYHFKTDAAGEVSEIIDPENDHWLDALRYGLDALFAKSNFTFGGGLDIDNDSAIDKNGNYLRMPTPEEFAKNTGTTLGAEQEDVSKIGEIGKISDLEDDENKDQVGGDGSFLWSL